MAYPGFSLSYSGHTGQDWSSETAIPFDTVSNDTHSFYDPCDTGKITIPAGFAGWGIWAELSISINNVTGGDNGWLRIRHADACAAFISQGRIDSQVDTGFGMGASTQRLWVPYLHHSVSVGDVLFFYSDHGTDTSSDVTAAYARGFLLPPAS